MRLSSAGAVALLVLLAGGCGPSSGRGPDLAPIGSVGSLQDFLTVCAQNGTVPGIDVSQWQSTIDWTSVKAAGIQWSYAKATEGSTFEDPQFANNWPAMKTAGVTRGAYHFFRPATDGKVQADNYLSVVGPLGPSDLPPMLDWEVTDSVSTATGMANATAFIDEIHARTGRPTVIYTSPGVWPSLSTGNYSQDPLWVADWLYCTSGCCPVMPTHWADWVFWQYSNKGSVGGISGAVDLDVFNGNAAGLGGFAGSCKGPVGQSVGSGGPSSGPCGGGPASTTPPQGCGAMAVGDGLGAGESVSSCDGRFTLTMQTDGNVVLTSNGIAVWSTGTAGSTGNLFTFQSDGNLVLYDATGCAIWSSNTSGNTAATFSLQDDGNLVVYSGGTALWASGSGSIGAKPTTCGTVTGGQGLAPGDVVTSCGGCFHLSMQEDGNLVLYQKGVGALWSTHTTGQDGYTASMKANGNLVVYSKRGCKLWSSATSGNSGASLSLQDDGNLVVVDSGGTPLWATATVACNGGCTCNAPPPDGGTPDGGTASDGGATTSDGGGGASDGGGGASDGGGGASDGGTTTKDGGTSTNDGGTPKTDGGTSHHDGGSVSGSCGCSATESGSAPETALLVLLAIVALRRRRA